MYNNIIEELDNWFEAFNRYPEFLASLEAIIRQLPEKRLQHDQRYKQN